MPHSFRGHAKGWGIFVSFTEVRAEKLVSFGTTTRVVYVLVIFEKIFWWAQTRLLVSGA